MNLDRDLFLTDTGEVCESTHPRLKILIGLRGTTIDDERAHRLHVGEYLAAHPLPNARRRVSEDPAAVEAKAVEKAEVEDKAVAGPPAAQPPAVTEPPTVAPEEPTPPPGVHWPPDVGPRRGGGGRRG